jgi:hypothetical protein
MEDGILLGTALNGILDGNLLGDFEGTAVDGRPVG